MAISVTDIIRLAPEIAQAIDALEDVFDGKGNMRKDAAQAVAEVYDVFARLSPGLALLPRQRFVQIVNGGFIMAEGVQGLLEAKRA